MSLNLIDTHCHLDFEVFDDDRADVLRRAADSKISDIVIPGTKKIYWDRIKELCSENMSANPRLHACYGLHPYWVTDHNDHDITVLQAYIDRHRPVAIGECGLDFRPQQADKKMQLYYFEAQLDLAENSGLPVVIHSVKATEAVIQTVKKFKNLKGMIHSYSGSTEQARQLIDLNFYISLGAGVTYDNATRLRKVTRDIPLTSLLLETDSPDQLGQSQPGQRNEPAYLLSTLEVIAGLRDVQQAVIAQQTTVNAKKLFGI